MNVLRPRSAKDYEKVDRKNLFSDLTDGSAHSDDDLAALSSPTKYKTKYPEFCSLPRRKSEPFKLTNR